MIYNLHKKFLIYFDKYFEKNIFIASNCAFSFALVLVAFALPENEDGMAYGILGFFAYVAYIGILLLLAVINLFYNKTFSKKIFMSLALSLIIVGIGGYLVNLNEKREYKKAAIKHRQDESLENRRARFQKIEQ